MARPLPAPESPPPPLASTPLVSAQPLRARVQRAPLTAPGASSRREATRDTGHAAPSSTPVKIHRGTVASELAETLDARAFTHRGEIFLPASAGPMASPTARALIAHELTHVAQQRAYGSSLPEEHTSHGQELERRAAAAERRPDLLLAAPPTKPSPAPASTPEAAAPQRKPAAEAAVPSAETTTINLPETVQRAPADAPLQTGPRRTDQKAKAKSETELEELAGQLYPRISRRLRRELLVDRERAGVMVDLR